MQMTASAVALAAASGFAMGATYPTRPVTLIVFVPAGGGPDIIARLIGQELSKRLGQAVVIENRPGAGGNLALEAVTRAAPDGYSLLLVAIPHAVNATLFEKSHLNVARDIAPVAGISINPFFMLVAPSLPVRTVPEFIAYAKANPGKLNMTSTGTGNLSDLAGELFEMRTGINVVRVPYRGAVEAHEGLTAGEVQVMFDGLGSAMASVKSGAVRALAVTSARRWPELPDIPAVAEFVPNYVVNGWLGVGAPRATPPEIIDRLNKEINAVLAEPGIKSKLANLGFEPLTGSPADFGKYIVDDTAKWAEVIHAAHIKTQ